MAGGGCEYLHGASEEDARMVNGREQFVIAPNCLVLLKKIYDAAQKVAENPDTHLAGVAARRLIAAFHGDEFRDTSWLRYVSPSGTA
jgi:hypothetical protein